MADQYRYRHGQMELVKFGVASATVIERNDMLFYASSDNDVKPASDLTWENDLATTQTDFADVFAGIAYEASANGDTDDISVDTSPNSVYEYDVVSATYELDNFLGPDQESGPVLADQELEQCSTAARAVAKPFERATTATTLLKVKFASAYNPSANNANVQLG